MKEALRKFLESNLLEDYLLGTLSESDNAKVESFIEKYPEVKQKFNFMQEDIEKMAMKTAIPAPPDLKKNILKATNELDEIAIDEKDLLTRDNQAKVINKTPRWAFAACFAALAFALASAYLWNQTTDLKNQLAEKETELIRVKNLSKEEQSQRAILASQINIMNDASTDRFVLKGNEKARAFTTIAYWNKSNQSAYLKIDNLPSLNNKKCYQMWADVDGKMVSLGVIKDSDGGLIKLPFKSNATSLNVTIEEEGGSDHPDVSQLVSSVVI